jgi:phage shock protein A
MMSQAAKLREQAEKALRLARQTPDHLTSARLIDLAKEYISRAELLESSNKP